ncbi:MAG: DeoR/GlpR transcriptional regulator [Oscillospiraceae bacterium]|nr:DeoR/GlpR transcriptional regulator [Oscillospiraceae bacterium]
MLKEERYDRILSILEKEQYISALQLSKMLYVSLPTIRRDLAELRRRNQIIRSHGGAKVIQAEHIVAPLDFRKTVNAAEKRALCRQAATMVNDYDLIFIDSSTTTLQMADFLSDKKGITVITNGIPLATLLVQKGIKTYCTGGEIFENSLAHFGSFAEDFIQRFNIDTLFFSCHGVNENGVLTDPSLPETQIRRVAIHQSKKTVFLCDETKLGLSTPYNLVPIRTIDQVITNSEKVRRLFQPEEAEKITVI